MKKKQQIETHGKVEVSQPTTLEQVWGFNEMSRYGTLDPDEYDKVLAQMNRTDLEAHARKLGVVIVESSLRLQDKLRAEFKNYVTYLRKPAEPQPSKASGKIDPAALKVLAEGR
jgi:hypothetical protein